MELKYAARTTTPPMANRYPGSSPIGLVTTSTAAASAKGITNRSRNTGIALVIANPQCEEKNSRCTRSGDVGLKCRHPEEGNAIVPSPLVKPNDSKGLQQLHCRL